MTKKRSNVRIWWIDDETDRLKPSAQQAIRHPDQRQLPGRSAELTVIKLGKNMPMMQVLADFNAARNAGKSPDLIIVDQMLNQLSNGDGVVQKGSSFAVALRDKDPMIPLVGVTGAPFSDVAELQKRQFIEFFPRDDLQSGARIPDLYAIADGFVELINLSGKASAATHSSKQLLRLLNCPVEDSDLLLNCIPGEFRSEWDQGTPHGFACWIWHTLLGRPGFLYDELETSTLLGLKPEGLNKLTKLLKNCKYAGAFVSASRPRWWISRVRQTVRELTNAKATEPLWTLGRKLVGEKEKETYSRCHGISGGDVVPSVVAFSDGTLHKRVQAHIEDTKPLENDTPPLGFEQRRVFARR